MNLLDYFDFIELERPDNPFLDSDELLNKRIELFTQNSEIGELSEYDIIILGIPECRNSYYKGIDAAPNAIRKELYSLIAPETNKKILDLGNIKQGNTFKDTYFATKEVIYHLLCKNVNIVVIGGTQELTVPIYQAFEQYQDQINLATIDSTIDYKNDVLDYNPHSYLNTIVLKKQNLFKYINLAHQTYLTENKSLQVIKSLYHQAIRLGDLRAELPKTESILRDIDLVSFDMSAVCQGDAPASSKPSPNGLRADEACVLSRFSGISDRLRVFFLSEIIPANDIYHQTSKLAAQMIWYFIEGVSIRANEFPEEENGNFKTFIVSLSDLDQEIIFYRSLITGRWWFKIPSTKYDKDYIVPCNHSDYEMASMQEVPDLWWKYYQKLN